MKFRYPDFGVDHDIISTQKHIADQEKRLKTKLNIEPEYASAFVGGPTGSLGSKSKTPVTPKEYYFTNNAQKKNNQAKLFTMMQL